jgi:mono/diheme cytochrome c family protein
MPHRLVAIAVFLLFASPAVAQTVDGGSIQRGHALVQRNCAMCHATENTGDSPNPLSPHFRDLDKRYPIEDLAEALAEGIMVGHPQMPQFRFAPDEVNDIIAYLKSIQTKQHAGLTPPPAG